ncbi:PLB1 [Branchiostoma lanceolatum]|uniref:Phospholipase B1, membrane-associated n=1 Tax=Branchiostoma lanceolatum TaxID=7740 RepID=A0A8J9YMR2_BRALA|nr:PLB1 [Branchiostoma lanceolatum]
MCRSHDRLAVPVRKSLRSVAWRELLCSILVPARRSSTLASMVPAGQVLVFLTALWGCCATLDLQSYERRVSDRLAASPQLAGPGSGWQRYQAAVEVLQAEANRSSTVERLQASVQTQTAGAQLNCPLQKSNSAPTSVHRLRPEDVKVVGAIGDSLTAASGAKARTIIGLLTNYRGVSWSIGGEKTLDTYTTLPNILRKFNPEIVGFATGSGGPDSGNAQLDQAVAGAVSGMDRERWPKKIIVMTVEGRNPRGRPRKRWIDNIKEDLHHFNLHDVNPQDRGTWRAATKLPHQHASTDMAGQARRLVDLIKACEHIDFDHDWKVVTLLIGGNDLCDYCEDKERRSPEKYVENIQAALDILHQELPRTFVNVVTVMDVVEISKLQRTFVCDVLHFFLCRCVSFASEEELAEIQAVNMRYMSVTNQLVASGRYDDRDDFTVVVQPFLQETKLPRTESGDYDRSYFAPDCFHFGLKAHAAAASALWNNMLEPVGSKRTDWHIGEPVECPTEERPYFATAHNSRTSLGSAGPSVGVKTFRSFLKDVTSQDGSKPASGSAALAMVGCLLLICAAVGGAVYMQRRRRVKGQVKGQETQPLLQESSDMASTLVVS